MNAKQTKRHTPDPAKLATMKREGDRIISRIAETIRNCPAGMPVVIEAPKEVPLIIIETLIQRAIETTEAEGITIHGLIVDIG